MPRTKASRAVAIIGAGGTISTLIRADLEIYDYSDMGVRLGAGELADSISEYVPNIDLLPIEFRSIRSGSLNPNDWLELNEVIHQTAESTEPINGIVVTHGTATLEETAYFLNLTLKLDIPVVVVGAMRPRESPGTDATRNLLNAVRVAAAPVCADLGVLVLMNDEVHSARDVTKGATRKVDAFATPDLGALGYADVNGEIDIYRRPTRHHAPGTIFDVRGLEALPRVDIAYSYVGADGSAIDAFIKRGARGIVSNGLGSGYTTPDERLSLIEARRRGIIVVQSSRTGSGRVVPTTRSRRDQIVTSDGLNAQKARVLTMLGLTVTSDWLVVQEYFGHY